LALKPNNGGWVWDEAYLKCFYHVNDKFHDNHKDVRNYYRDKIDLVICNFGAHANLRHDKNTMD
jgi:hypothetical protein